MYDEIAKLQSQGRALKYGLIYAAVIGTMLGAAWLGFDTGEHHQARADIRQVAQWVASAEIPTVQETYPGKMAVAIIQDGYCRVYPRHLPATFRVEWVAPNYEPCASQHYAKPTSVSPALAAIIKHTEGKSWKK
jgi:hypothetical protein